MDWSKLTWLVWHSERLLLAEKGQDDFIGWEKIPICPFKGKCYEVTVAIYELMGEDGLSLYRMKDMFDEWHWFMIVDETYQQRQKGIDVGNFIIDATEKQYRHPLVPPTNKVRFGEIGSELNDCEYMKKPLHYPSYKDKVEKFKKKLLLHIENHNNRAKPVRIDDFVEKDDKQEQSASTEKPVTLDDFFV